MTATVIAYPDEPDRDTEFQRFRWETAQRLREATGWDSVARFIIMTEPGLLHDR